MRPEMTPTVARMVATAERAYKKPIKWFSLPQLFRYEKQQKGRLREHFQFNCDIFGETDTGADAEIIALLIDVLRAFGLTRDEFAVRLSSRRAWQECSVSVGELLRCQGHGIGSAMAILRVVVADSGQTYRRIRGWPTRCPRRSRQRRRSS